MLKIKIINTDSEMNDVLEKPLNIENLKIILNKYLNDKTVSK